MTRTPEDDSLPIQPNYDELTVLDKGDNHTIYKAPDGTHYIEDDYGLRIAGLEPVEHVAADEVSLNPDDTSGSGPESTETDTSGKPGVFQALGKLTSSDPTKPQSGEGDATSSGYSLDEEAKFLHELSPERHKLIANIQAALAKEFGLSTGDFQPLVVESEEGKKVLIVQSSHEGIKFADPMQMFNNYRVAIHTANIRPFGHMTKELYRTLIEAERARGTQPLTDSPSPINGLPGTGTYMDGEEIDRYDNVDAGRIQSEGGEIWFSSAALYNTQRPPKHRAVVDVDETARKIELSQMEPEIMPGGSPQTAILLSEEECGDIRKALAISDARRLASWHPDNQDMQQLASETISSSSKVTGAAKDILDVDEAKTGFARLQDATPVWVRVEGEYDTNSVGTNGFNTWQIETDEENYGDWSGEKLFYRTDSDGSVRVVARLLRYGFESINEEA